MSSLKRKSAPSNLQRRVRARRESSLDIEDLSDSTTSSAPQVRTNGKHLDNADSDGDESSESEDDSAHSRAEGEAEVGSDNDSVASNSDSDSDSEEDEDLGAAAISFGALAKAQASLSAPKSSRKKSKASTEASSSTDNWQNNEALERKAGRKDTRDFSRTSKHAPTEVSSKKAVSRRREVIPVAKITARDPRFDAISGVVDTSKIKKAYSFLDDYRDTEIQDLKLSIKKSKDENEKERMKRTLLSLESRKKTDDRKRKQEEILAKHKAEEKELVKQGKQPFYLKESEKKKRVLLETYGAMKKGELDHVIERRRRKLDQKEKKNLPWARRGAE